MPKNEVKEVFTTYTERIRSSKSGINISNIINAPVNPTAIGEIAPLFDGPTPPETVSLLKAYAEK